MALNFPSSPTDGQIYTDTATGKSYKYSTTYGYWSSYIQGGGFFQGNNGDINIQNIGDILRSHSNTLTGNVTVYSGTNSQATGPLTLDDGSKLTVETGARLVIL